MEHIISGCKFLAATQYKSRYDSVAKILHWWLCRASSLPYSVKWWNHAPLPGVEDDVTKILLDFNVYTDRMECN